jgi:hypothetical protein
MRIRKRNRILRQLVLGFAVLALVVPGAATAEVDEGLGAKAGQQSYVPFVTDFPKNVYRQSRDGIEIVRLEPRSTLRDSDLIEQVRMSPRDVSSPQVVSSPGFDWGDAAIGAGFLAAIVLLGAGALYATRQVGKPQTA